MAKKRATNTDIQIESGVKLWAEKRPSRESKLAKVLAGMKIGDSFVASRGRRQYCVLLAKEAGIHLTARMIEGTDTYRVWRVKGG